MPQDFIDSITLKNGLLLSIVKAQIEDAEEIIRFLNQVGGESDYLTFGLNEFPLSANEEKDEIIRCLESNICLMLVGKINNEIISQLFVQRSAAKRLVHIGDIAISVSKKYWGNKIAFHMMQPAIKWCMACGVSKVQLYVRVDHDRAILLYKKLGFAIEGTITRATKINDIYFDNYIMGLEL